MAKFKMELPTELMEVFKSLDSNTEKMCGDMCKAGADVVMSNIKGNMPHELRNALSNENFFITKVYKTPSDGGINVQPMIVGYFTNSKGETVPAPLVANMFEYGSQKRKYPKHPFLRKSFRKAQIEKAMMDVQKKYIKED